MTVTIVSLRSATSFLSIHLNNSYNARVYSVPARAFVLRCGDIDSKTQEVQLVSFALYALLLGPPLRLLMKQSRVVVTYVAMVSPTTADV